MIRDSNIDKNLLMKAITAQRFVLDNAQYATVVIRDYSKYSIICHGDQSLTNDYDSYLDAVAYDREKDSFQFGRHTRNNSINNARDVHINPNDYRSKYDLEWNKNGITKDINNANGDNIEHILRLISEIQNIIDLENMLTKITIWDDGTYRINIYEPASQTNPIIECDSWYEITHIWSDDKISKEYVNGKLLRNLRKNDEKIEQYDIHNNVDYIEIFNNRKSLWLGLKT